MLLRPRAAKRRGYERHTVKVILGQNKIGIVLNIEVLMAIVFR